MLLGVTTGVTTGEHGAGFAGAANAGTDIGAADARASISAFMTRLHIWTIAVFGISASAAPALAGLKMPTLVRPARDMDHKFRTIQNDSDCPGSQRNVLARGLPTPWRGLRFAASTSSLSTATMAVERSLVGPSSSLDAGWHQHCKHRALARIARHRHIAAHHARELAR